MNRRVTVVRVNVHVISVSGVMNPEWELEGMVTAGKIDEMDRYFEQLFFVLPLCSLR